MSLSSSTQDAEWQRTQAKDLKSNVAKLKEHAIRAHQIKLCETKFAEDQNSAQRVLCDHLDAVLSCLEEYENVQRQRQTNLADYGRMLEKSYTAKLAGSRNVKSLLADAKAAILEDVQITPPASEGVIVFPPS